MRDDASLFLFLLLLLLLLRKQVKDPRTVVKVNVPPLVIFIAVIFVYVRRSDGKEGEIYLATLIFLLRGMSTKCLRLDLIRALIPNCLVRTGG